MQKIIINADDFGLNPSFDGGILDCIEKSVVSSVSVMVLREKNNMQKLLKYSKLSIGLHLELSEKADLEEFEKQIEVFKNLFGKLPSHLDGHNHCHLSEYSIKKTILVAQKYALPVRSKAELDRQTLLKNNIKTPESFIGWHPNKKELMFEKLKNEESKITELVCHPGFYDSNAGVLYNESREKEMKVLQSQAFAEILKNFQLISYLDL